MSVFNSFIKITSIIVSLLIIVSCEKAPNEVPEKYMAFFPYTTIGEQHIFKSNNGNNIIVDDIVKMAGVDKECHGGRDWYSLIFIDLVFHYGELNYNMKGDFTFKKRVNNGQVSGSFQGNHCSYFFDNSCVIKNDTLFIGDSFMKFVKDKGLVEVNLSSIHDEYPKLPNETWTLIE